LNFQKDEYLMQATTNWLYSFRWTRWSRAT